VVTDASTLSHRVVLRRALPLAAPGTPARTAPQRALLRRAVRHGVRSGIRSERARMLRFLHDTTLQSLEAMARQSTSDNPDPVVVVAQLREVARAEALRLRSQLGELTGWASPGATSLATALSDVVAEVVARGLRVALVVSDLAGVAPTRDRRAALCGATGAALSNVWRHAQVSRATVRVEPAAGGVRVVVRDHGRGIGTDPARFGFGIRESILARLAEVGGWATVEPAAGTGTRVTLWVPA
jgi:signal transduction histidine kinase